MRQKLYSFKALTAIMALTVSVTGVASAAGGAEALFSEPSVQTIAQGSITGNVVDKAGAPIVGAIVSVEGTTKATFTDVDGNFKLNDVKPSDKIKISCMGYKAVVIEAGQTNVKVVLEEDMLNLDDVIVVGYGTQKKSDLTGGIAVMNSKQLDRKPGGSLLDKMQGQVAGLNVTINNSKPGSDVGMIIRGEKSLSGSTAPLVVLNGSPFSGSLQDIDPSSVESMTVLKDASSSAIYGSRAANGVILVTTKKGSRDRVSVTYRGYVTVQSLERKINMMEGEEWLQYMTDYAIATGKSGSDLEYSKILKANVYEMYQKGIQTDWQDEMYQTSVSHNHHVGINGGNDNVTYYFAASYLDDKGIVKGSKYSRFNINANVEQKIGKWLTVGLNAMFTQRDSGGTTPYTLYGLYLSPYGKNKDENGNIVDYPLYAETMYYHPFANTNGTVDNITNNTFANGFIDIKFPVEGLSFRSSFGYNLHMNNSGSYYGRNTLSGRASGGSATISNTRNWNYTWENTLNYNRTFGKHSISAVALFSAQQSENVYSKMSGEKFVNDDNLYHQIEAAENNKKIESDHSGTSMLSWMGRVNYGFDNRYMITLTCRSDGYSAFGINNKWAVFPSAAVAWNISNEAFFANVSPKAVSQLKLRLSYGGNGNQGVNPYQTLDRYTTQQYVFGDGENTVNGVFLPYNGIGNPNLRWETTYSTNVGVDFGFLNHRLNGSVEFYQTNTSDLLMSRNVPVMNGYTSILDNVGKTRNTGVEVTLNSANIQNKNFSWDTRVVYSYNNDQIIALREDGKDDISNKWFIGQNLRVYYDYKVDGVWQLTDDIKNSHQPNAKPGDSKLVDTNGDGKLTSADRQILGSRIPKHNISMVNEFRYKNFTLSFMLNGVFGVTKEDPFVNMQRFLPEKNSNYISGMNYWTPTNPSNDAPSPGYTRVNDHFYYLDASYVRLSDVTLNYSFGSKVIKALKIKDLSLYVSGKNLYTFNTKAMKGYDPEAAADNLLGCYPRARQFMLGLNITF